MDATSLNVRIARKAVEAEDIITLELASVDGKSLPSFSAGSHIDVEVAPGLIRQYSLCNDSQETHRYLIGVLKDPQSRGGSVAVHDALLEGQQIRISTPRNHFPLAHHAPRSLLFAGGIGVTPILCMAERLALTGGNFAMHYCTRSRNRTAFISRIESSAFADQVSFHFDDAGDEQRLDLNAVLQAENKDTHIYVCGPTGFMDFVINSAREAGWPDSHIHFEYFAAKAVDTSADESFEVQVASTGKVYQVGPEDSIAAVLAADGVDVMTSCEQGICGACITRVLEGSPEHRDQVLSDEERADDSWITPCCSRSKSPRLVLDL